MAERVSEQGMNAALGHVVLVEREVSSHEVGIDEWQVPSKVHNGIGSHYIVVERSLAGLEEVFESVSHPAATAPPILPKL